MAALLKKVLPYGLMLSTIIVFSCATPPPPPQMTIQERVKRDNVLGNKIAEDFQGRISFKNDVELSVYLRKIAELLIHTKEELRDAPIGIFIVQDREGQWQNFSIPGNRIYLSLGLIQTFQFENELAAAIAFELANILRRHLVRHLELTNREEGSTLAEEISPSKLSYFGPGGVFTFNDDDYISSIEPATSMLYQAGFDPRGLNSIWQKMKDNPKASSFYPATLDRLLAETRTAIAEFPPLRNPVVRSKNFLKMKKRIQQL